MPLPVLQRALLEKLGSARVQPADKLRLAMLYALRYEEHPATSVRALKTRLVDGGVAPERAALLDALLAWAGRAARGGLGLYAQGNLMSLMAKSLTSTLQGVENVYSQHVPYVMSLVEVRRAAAVCACRSCCRMAWPLSIAVSRGMCGIWRSVSLCERAVSAERHGLQTLVQACP
jgi:hypothetical protein